MASGPLAVIPGGPPVALDDRDRMKPEDDPLLRVENLSVRFANGAVSAVNGVSLDRKSVV